MEWQRHQIGQLIKGGVVCGEGGRGEGGLRHFRGVDGRVLGWDSFSKVGVCVGGGGGSEAVSGGVDGRVIRLDSFSKVGVYVGGGEEGLSTCWLSA